MHACVRTGGEAYVSMMARQPVASSCFAQVIKLAGILTTSLFDFGWFNVTSIGDTLRRSYESSAQSKVPLVSHIGHKRERGGEIERV